MSIREHYDASETLRRAFEAGGSQETLSKALTSYRQTCDLIRRHGLFSANETIDDVVTTELRYFLPTYHMATLQQQERSSMETRAIILEQSARQYRDFLLLCSNYDVVAKKDISAVEHILHPTAPTPEVRKSSADTRAQKIQRYKDDKALQDHMARLTKANLSDEDISRDLLLTSIRLAVSRSVQEVESIDLELAVLKIKPPPSISGLGGQSPQTTKDVEQTWKLDTKTPYLDSQGKVLSPFVITSKRDTMRKGVFRPDHSLPTMSIDEYLDLERARGGILDADSSAPPPVADPDDHDTLEVERQKAIAWDKFTEENAKGAGNTMNRG